MRALSAPVRGLAVGVWLAAAATAAAQAPAPAVSKLAGTWTWTWSANGATHRHVLEVEGVDAKLAAREIFDDQEPVRVANLTFDGKAVKFTVARGDRKAEYSGRLADNDHLNGTVTVTADGQSDEHVWKAERRKEVPKPK